MSDTEYATKLFEQLDALSDGYKELTRENKELNRRAHRAITLATGSVALLATAVLWFLFVSLPEKTEEIQRSRSAVIYQFCQDEKSLLTLVPPGYPLPAQAAEPDSALNPRRDCGQFVRAHVP